MKSFAVLALIVTAVAVTTSGAAQDVGGEEKAVGKVLDTTAPAATQPNAQQADGKYPGISMTCGAGGTSIWIRASNSSKQNRNCESRCFYKTKQGYSGTLKCNGTVPANANNVLFCHRSSSNESPYKVTDPGYHSCS